MRFAGLAIGGALACALALGAGCGAGDASGDDSAVDGGGSGGDAGDGCFVGVTYNPSDPVEGDTVTMTASVPEGDGFYEYRWTVDGSEDGLTPAMVDRSAMRFTFAGPGTYAIGLDVVGTPCIRWDDVLPVRALGATQSQWRLRFSPPPWSTAPPQELIRTVLGGADWDVGDVALDPGATITGEIADGSGTAIAAYLRLTPTGTPDLAIDAFASAADGFEYGITLVRHDLLIIPYRADLAPRLVRDWTPQPGDHEVDAGTAVTGTVIGPDGSGVIGATVTLRVGGVPSSIGTTGAGGAFTVRARPVTSALVEVVVVPPTGSGLPRLTSSPAVLDLGVALAIEYADTLTSRDVAGATVTLGGVSAAGAEVTFTGSIGNAALVSTGAASAQAAGSFAIAVTSNGSGVLPSANIPVASGLAVVAPASGTPSTAPFDDNDTTFAAPSSSPVTGRVVGPTGTPVVSADLRAVPTGALAAAGAGEVHVVAAADGTFALPLAAGGSYDLLIVDRHQDLSLLRTSWTGGALGDLALPDGLHLGGRVTLSGSGTMVGAAVTLFCESCPEAERAQPAAAAATDGGGRFRATVLDSGTE